MFRGKKRASGLALTAVCVGAIALSGCSNAGLAGSGGAGLGADGDCTEFQGESIDFVIPYDAGGGYDILARAIIPGLENALGATVVPVNKAGAGGLLAINQLVAAKPDGRQIGIVNGTGAASSILADAVGPAFGFDDLSYVGRVAVDDLIVTTKAGGEYQTWDDIENSDGFRFASTGRGSSDYIVANALIKAFDLKNAEVKTGFGGQSEADLAVIQGNVDAIAGPLDSRRSSIQGGESVGVLSFADEAPEDAPDAVVFDDLDLTQEQQDIVDGVKLLSEYGRTIIAPPEMNEGTLGCLQDALEAAVEDPETLEQAERTQRALSFMSGQELTEKVVPSFDDLSDDFIQVLKDSY